MGNRQACFFVGHRNTPESIRPDLLTLVDDCMAAGYKEFIVGHHGQFDTMAASVVKELKPQYPDVQLIMLLPYHPAEYPIELPSGFDAGYYPSGMEAMPRSLSGLAASFEATRLAILDVECVIAYVCHPGRARNFTQYAEWRGINVEYV